MTIFKVNIVVCWRRCILAIESKLWRFFYFPLLFSLWFFFFLHNLINTPVIHVHVPEWRADTFFLCEKQPVSTVNGSKSTAHLNRSANVLYSVTVVYWRKIHSDSSVSFPSASFSLPWGDRRKNWIDDLLNILLLHFWRKFRHVEDFKACVCVSMC